MVKVIYAIQKCKIAYRTAYRDMLLPCLQLRIVVTIRIQGGWNTNTKLDMETF